MHNGERKYFVIEQRLLRLRRLGMPALQRKPQRQRQERLSEATIPSRKRNSCVSHRSSIVRAKLHNESARGASNFSVTFLRTNGPTTWRAASRTFPSAGLFAWQVLAARQLSLFQNLRNFPERLKLSKSSELSQPWAWDRAAARGDANQLAQPLAVVKAIPEIRNDAFAPDRQNPLPECR